MSDMLVGILGLAAIAAVVISLVRGRMAEANLPGRHFPVYNDPASVIIREMIT